LLSFCYCYHYVNVIILLMSSFCYCYHSVNVIILLFLSLFQMPSQDVSPATASPPGYSEDDFRAMLSKIGSLQEENVFINQKLQVRIGRL
jgi:hypothetical protein